MENNIPFRVAQSRNNNNKKLYKKGTSSEDSWQSRSSLKNSRFLGKRISVWRSPQTGATCFIAQRNFRLLNRVYDHKNGSVIDWLKTIASLSWWRHLTNFTYVFTRKGYVVIWRSHRKRSASTKYFKYFNFLIIKLICKYLDECNLNI